MLNVDYRVEYGEIKIRQTSDKKLYTIKIHWANALCAFIYHYKKDGKRWASLKGFFGDEQHVKNVAKENNGDCLIWISEVGKITSIKLNLYYKESNTLLKHFVKAGYKVECYYKEPKKK